MKKKTKAKQEYYHNNFKNSKTPKKTWEIIQSLTGRSTERNELSDHFLLNGTQTNDKKKIAGFFNNFFKNVGPNLSKKFPPITDFEKFLTKQQTSFSFQPISDNAQDLNRNHHLAGPDGIPTKIIKSCINSPIMILY